jgi:hypothetical protein
MAGRRGFITCRYMDYRRADPERRQVMTLATDEFIRRFLLHVLPRGFHRIRHYGLLAGASGKDNLAQARRLLAVPPPTVSAPDKEAELHPPCPCCGGRMIMIEDFARRSRTAQAAASVVSQTTAQHKSP